jgi:uncharacterized membrane protein YqjE
VADRHGIEPPETAEKSLGEIVAEVSEKAALLVREEVELAKAEVQTKVTRLGKAIAVGAAAGLFVLLAVYMFTFALGFFFVDLFNLEGIWTAFLIGTALWLVLAGIAGFLAYKFVKKGSPPTPEMAIEEAKLTRKAIDEVRR